jgi:hypothetical protein
MFADEERDAEEQPASEEPLPEPPEVDEAAETIVAGSWSEVEEEPPDKTRVEGKPVPAQDDWVTAEFSKGAAQPPPAEKAPPAAPAKKVETPPAEMPPPPVPPAAEKTVLAGTSDTAFSEPAAATPFESAAAPAENFMGPVGNLLAKIGITSRQTQQWVTIGVAVLVLGCCACSCIGVIIATTSGSGF